MSQMVRFLLASSFILSIFSFTANAALIERLNGLAVYDNVNDITWIANANLALTETFGLLYGVDYGSVDNDKDDAEAIIFADGTMTWSGALRWIDAMNASNYLGFNDWRLPITPTFDTTCSILANPSIDFGFDCVGSELGDLFYNGLSASSADNVFSGDATELMKFSNLQSAIYWSGSKQGSQTSKTSSPWAFRFDNGFQGGLSTTGVFNIQNVLVVRSGDLAVVSEPSSYGLLLMTLFWMLNKRKTARKRAKLKLKSSIINVH